MAILIKVFALIALVSTIEACQTNDCGGGSTCRNTGGRRRRSVQSEVEDGLVKFNVRLRESLANEISGMNEADKEQFFQDLESMNAAVVLEAESIDTNNRGPAATIVRAPREYFKTVSDKVFSHFNEQGWFQRLRAIGVDKIAQLQNNLDQDV